MKDGFLGPHVINVDPEGHVWVIERDNHRITKLNKDLNTVAMQLGTPGVPGADATHFNLPTDVDQTFKLLGLIWAQAPRHDVVRQQQVLSKLQRPDGGWGQMPTLSPDAYATGQALYALQVAGVDAEDPVYRRGVDFLLRTQLEDGTWFVRTRAFGVQPYFETGFPHGPSQFISATATAWAAIALTHTAR